MYIYRVTVHDFDTPFLVQSDNILKALKKAIKIIKKEDETTGITRTVNSIIFVDEIKQ